MKKVLLIIMIVFLFSTLGCASLGNTYLSNGQVAVSIGPAVTHDRKKLDIYEKIKV